MREGGHLTNLKKTGYNFPKFQLKNKQRKKIKHKEKQARVLEGASRQHFPFNLFIYSFHLARTMHTVHRRRLTWQRVAKKQTPEPPSRKVSAATSARLPASISRNMQACEEREGGRGGGG